MNIEGVGEGGGDDDGDMMIMRGCRTQPVNNVRFFSSKSLPGKNENSNEPNQNISLKQWSLVFFLGKSTMRKNISLQVCHHPCLCVCVYGDVTIM